MRSYTDSLVTLLSFPSMLQGLASRAVRRNTICYQVRSSRTNHHLFSRPVLVSGGYGCSYAPAVLLSVRHYAQQTPPGGQGGGGGIPGFKFPMQQQYAKGDALKEFVRVTRCPFCSVKRSSFFMPY